MLPSPVYLYIKTHVASGIKYFGRTTANPHTYPGSGSAWRRLLRDECSEVITEIYGVYTNEEELAQAALKFSQENNIVKDPMWANKRPEPGVLLPWGQTIAIINASTETWYSSFSAAAIAYGADPRNLSRAVYNHVNKWQASFWILEDELPAILSDYGSLSAYVKKMEEMNRSQKRRGGHTDLPHGGKKNLRAVVCIQTGEVFTTTGAAGEAKGLSRTSVYFSAERYEAGAKQYKGKEGREKLHWRWANEIEVSSLTV